MQQLCEAWASIAMFTFVLQAASNGHYDHCTHVARCLRASPNRTAASSRQRWGYQYSKLNADLVGPPLQGQSNTRGFEVVARAARPEEVQKAVQNCGDADIYLAYDTGANARQLEPCILRGGNYVSWLAASLRPFA